MKQKQLEEQEAIDAIDEAIQLDTKRRRKSTTVTVDGHDVLKRNNVKNMHVVLSQLIACVVCFCCAFQLKVSCKKVSFFFIIIFFLGIIV